MKVGIIGTGPWGRALATLVAEAGHQPRIGYRSTAPRGFPGTPNLAALVQESDLSLVAVPPQGVLELVDSAKPGAADILVLASRGLCPESGGWLSDQVITRSACRRVGAISGPTLAAEVMARRPCALVIASLFDEVGDITQKALHSSVCRVYTSRDLRGVETAGAMVEMLACVIGMADALQLGLSVRGVIVSRGLAEATRLGLALDAEAHTFSGLAGVGDLVACGAHPKHPRYQDGRSMVTGGRSTRVASLCNAILKMATRHGVDLPITQAMAHISSGELEPRLAIDMLMRRAAREE